MMKHAFIVLAYTALMYYSYVASFGYQGHSGGGGGYRGGHGGGHGGGGNLHYLQALLHNPLVQCRLYGGSCVSIDNCNTTLNIYKDVCKSYSYDNVCCISRETVCQKFSGFCTNESSVCITSAQLFNNFGHHMMGHYHHGKPYVYKTVALSWLQCNGTHRCCHPVKVRKGGHQSPIGYSHAGGHHGGGGFGGGGGYGYGKK